MANRRISSHYLLTPQGFLPNRIVTVDTEGRITDISATGQLDREPGVQFYSGILIPGFVNSHCHLELSHMHGAIASGGGSIAFVEGMRKHRGRFTEAERRSAVDFWDAKMWAEGVSAVGDICNGALTFDTKQHSSIRYHSFAELFGLGVDPQRAVALRREAADMGLRASVTPHASYSLDNDSFSAAVGADDNHPLSIHFMESELEGELFNKRGGMWEWYAGEEEELDFLSYGSPARRVVAQVPPDRPIMLVHNCCVTQHDIDIIMGHFTAPVTWVLCPGSNRYISGLTPPVDLLRKNHLDIAVGTDSLASNTTLSMVHELGFFKDVPLEEMVGWATLNGAKSLGLDATAGSVEVGKSPGLVLLSGVDMEKMTLTQITTATRIV